MKENNDIDSATPKGAKLAFGIFMILFYIAIGILCIMKVRPFDIIDNTISYVVGGILIAYGIFRGYRLALMMKK